jgi:hypothetical protein
MQFTKTIQEWFADTWGGSLELPDGWYGRPYDNQHALTSVHQIGDTLTVELDKKLVLRFEGLKAVTRSDHEIVFGPFEVLYFEAESFGDDPVRHRKEYRSGTARLAIIPG